MVKNMAEDVSKELGGGQKSGEPIVLSDGTFAEAVSSHPLLIVDFWAPWCGPCKTLGPVIDDLAKKYAGKAVFAKMNVDDNPGTPGNFGIMGIPTLLFFKNGEMVGKLVGVAPEAQIAAEIDKHV